MNKYITWTVFLISVAVYYPLFFSSGTLSSGDWPYVYQEHMQELSLFEPPYIWLEPYYRATAKLGFAVELPWEISERLFWFLPIVVLSIFGSYQLTKSWIGSLIYATNTYVLMLIDGGQLGVAMGYAIIPLVVDACKALTGEGVTASTRQRVKDLLSFVLYFSLVLMFDVRMGFIAGIVCFLFGIIHLLTSQNRRAVGKQVLLTGTLAIFLICVLNAFWLMPLVVSGIGSLTGPSDSIYTSSDALSYFSVARFPQSFSLLHPNWPENIFGKVYLMKPEFLFLSLVAFMSIMTVSAKKTKSSHPIVLFFILIALTGSFLSKGVNEPFGFVYTWLFDYVPGFMMFRDPTKFYALTALSYSVLIPHTLLHISRRACTALTVLFVALWIYLLHPVWTGNLDGTFTPEEVPQEYLSFKYMLVSDPTAYTTFWVPVRQRFGYSSETHLAIDSFDRLDIDSIPVVVDWLESSEAHDQMQQWNVKYIIVPHDSEREIFVEKYEYCDACRKQIVHRIEQLTWLHRLDMFTRNDVFEVETSEGHVYGEQSETGNTSVQIGVFMSAGSLACVILMYLFLWNKTEKQRS